MFCHKLSIVRTNVFILNRIFVKLADNEEGYKTLDQPDRTIKLKSYLHLLVSAKSPLYDIVLRDRH